MSIRNLYRRLLASLPFKYLNNIIEWLTKQFSKKTAPKHKWMQPRFLTRFVKNTCHREVDEFFEVFHVAEASQIYYRRFVIFIGKIIGQTLAGSSLKIIARDFLVHVGEFISRHRTVSTIVSWIVRLIVVVRDIRGFSFIVTPFGRILCAQRIVISTVWPGKTNTQL